ncbi:hypothetical protein ACOME3_003776 [Neoechinorhynchus agilis]
MYGRNPKDSPDYSRLINVNQEIILCLRLLSLGGDFNEGDRYFSPTVVINVSPQSLLMQEEIFGPILPVLPVNSVDEAIDFVNRRPKPLALYLFTHNTKIEKKTLEGTTSGGVCINDCLMHIVPYTLPFGGVGESGMGKYHGRASFQSFSNLKSVAKHTWNFDVIEKKMTPPFTSKLSTIDKMLFTSSVELPTISIMKTIAAILLSAGLISIGFIIGHYAK